VTAVFGEMVDAFDAQDRARFRAPLADDLVVEDHRRTGMGRIEGADAYAASLVALWELAPETKADGGWHWLAHDYHGGLTALRRTGSVPGGGAFESECLWLGVLSGGRLSRLELFEVDAASEALARFAALRPDPLAIAPNAAVRALAQAAGDPAALRALAADDFMFDDRTRRSLLRGGVEE
jgi:ketosteroid isomerase-like protein